MLLGRTPTLPARPIRLSSECCDFSVSQISPLAGPQVGEFQWADGNSSKLSYGMAKHQHHSANLAVAPLRQDNAKFGAVSLRPDDLDRVESRRA